MLLFIREATVDQWQRAGLKVESLVIDTALGQIL